MAALLEKSITKDTHTPDDWNSLAVDVPQPLRGRYATNPLAQAMRLEQALERRMTAPLTSVPTAGTLLPKKILPVSSSTTEKHRMISPIAPKKALTSEAVAPAPTRQDVSVVQRFQEREELSPMGLMWQLVKDALGLRSQTLSVRSVPQVAVPSITPIAGPTYQIPPFKVRLQQRLQQVETPSTEQNPFALLPLQWASAPPLQRVVRQEPSPSQESVWF